MRCPDCSKFVGMENGDPEVNSIEVSYADGEFSITCDVRHTRNCADCSTELKDINHNIEASVKLADIESYKALAPEQRARLDAALKDDKAEIEIEEDGSEADESGGGRYAKNMIKVVVNYQLTVTAGNEEAPVTILHAGSLEESCQASGYDECC